MTTSWRRKQGERTSALRSTKTGSVGPTRSWSSGKWRSSRRTSAGKTSCRRGCHRRRRCIRIGSRMWKRRIGGAWSHPRNSTHKNTKNSSSKSKGGRRRKRSRPRRWSRSGKTTRTTTCGSSKKKWRKSGERGGRNGSRRRRGRNMPKRYLKRGTVGKAASRRGLPDCNERQTRRKCAKSFRSRSGKWRDAWHLTSGSNPRRTSPPRSTRVSIKMSWTCLTNCRPKCQGPRLKTDIKNTARNTSRRPDRDRRNIWTTTVYWGAMDPLR